MILVYPRAQKVLQGLIDDRSEVLAATLRGDVELCSGRAV